MSRFNLISQLTRLSLHSTRSPVYSRNICTTNLLQFQVSPCLLAEPLKKKKRLDPAIIKAREERRKKKIEKNIRRLEKHARQLKPIEECEIPLALTDEQNMRNRKFPPLNEAEMEKRLLLKKDWARYKQQQNLADLQMLDRIAYSQQKALDELRKESEELYQEAIQIEPMLIPFKTQGPVNTPPIENYDSPDGDYLDTSKKWN